MSEASFAVPLPAAGANAILAFEFADLEKLEADLGVGYVAKIMKGLNEDDTAIIRKCALVGVRGGDPLAALDGMSLDTLKAAIGDALTRRITGKAP
jgi:hypothetical protein